jgi:5'-nucleotidase
MHILIANDDGVNAQGIRHLAEAVAAKHDITVIAPDRDMSGSSNSLTLTRPLRLIPQDNGYIAVDGTPADCVHLGINGAIDNQPDMVLAGINHGPNLGDDIIYSGTVGAAMEGRFLDYPAIAVSLAGTEHFDTAAKIATRLLEAVDKLKLPPRCILNVNVPDLPYAEINGVQLTTLGNRHLGEPALKGKDPRGHRCFWIGKLGSVADASPGTDFHAIANGYVAVTPIAPDMASLSAFSSLSPWLEELL